METPHISIISPIYGSLNVLPELVQRIETSVATLTENYEIILVDDCGPGNAWALIQEESNKNPKVKGLKLSRNFGQHYAISAGLDQSKGEWVVVVDCDLQDLPESIPDLYQKAQEGFDLVLAARVDKQHSFFKKLFSWLFYGVLSWLTGVPYDHQIGNFGIYHRKVINAICELKEHIRFFPSMVRWVGFNSTTLPIKHGERVDGKSSYSLNKLLNIALEIILAYSDKPLRMAVKLGLSISFVTLALIVITIVRYLLGQIIVPGYFSIILSVWLLGGIIIFILGVVGLYVGKTFEGVKNRPIYIIDEKVNC